MEQDIRGITKIKIFIIVLLVLFLISYAISYFISFENKIAVIKIDGIIGYDSFSKKFVNPEAINEFIENAEKDSSVKGILLYINSPGGTAAASYEIMQKVKSCKKPVVAFINEIGTSGAYWIASAADKIVALPLSITGSIGVSASFIEFSGLMEKYGVRYHSIKAGEYKETGSPYKKPTEKEKELMQSLVNQLYEEFVKSVAENRNMSQEKVKELANGAIYLGMNAKQIGLVDYIGNKELAVNITKELAGIKKAELVYYEIKPSFVERILGNLASDFAFNFAYGLAYSKFKIAT